MHSAKQPVRASPMSNLDEQIREFLRTHHEVRDLLDLMRMTEEEYIRAWSAYQVPAEEASTVGSTGAPEKDVNVSATDR